MAPKAKLMSASIAALGLAALASPPPAAADSSPPACQGGGEASLAFLASPATPWKGAPVRLVVTSEERLDAELSLVGPDGKAAAASAERRGGPPYFWTVEVAAPQAGKWQARLTRKGQQGDCTALSRELGVARSPSAIGSRPGSVWPVREAWSKANEDLYSAWIEKLFDAPIGEAPSWKALHEVLRDRNRNLLFNHLGLREDEKGIAIKPDCADLPYFLRAYFAFKLGLPFGYAKCNRGGGGKAPRCPQWWNIQKEEPPQPDPLDAEQAGGGQPSVFGKLFGKPASQPVSKPVVKAMTKPKPKPEGPVNTFGAYLETIGEGVHSGSARTAATDDETDYYPVPISEASLRPGTVYADPYGHLLVIAKRVAQTGDSAGILLAVDGQPDGTVARKRFWRGNFLFAQDPGLGSPGFKRFRPVVRDGNGGLRRLGNAEIAKNAQYGDFSLEQAKLGVEPFYDRMDDVISPAPLDPKRAILEAITALDEQVNARVTSVENGRKYQAKGGREADMPDGPSIFETTGAWEDFATPSRDLRLLIAIDVVRGFPDRVERRPERYAMPQGKSAAEVKAELQALLAEELQKRKFSYTRSDGSSWTLTLKDVIERAGALEMAYNLNDCVELRWGAADGAEEAQTCKRRASAAQRQKMEGYRAWFHERRRPARA